MSEGIANADVPPLPKSETDSDDLECVILAALRAVDPNAYINEKWDGSRTVIDGDFDLEVVARYIRERFSG